MNNIPKILVLSFVGSTPETATELHQQIQQEIDKTATLKEIEKSLTELANANFIMTAERDDDTRIYWR